VTTFIKLTQIDAYSFEERMAWVNIDQIIMIKPASSIASSRVIFTTDTATLFKESVDEIMEIIAAETTQAAL
jgi:hypothetical protein